MAEKKTLSAMEIVADLRAGAADDFLVKKYGLTEKGLQNLFNKLVDAAVISQAELDRRASLQGEEVHESSAQEEPSAPITTSLPPPTQPVFVCPSCGLPQSQHCEVCPQCGVIVEKFKKKQAKEEEEKKRRLGEKLLERVDMGDIAPVTDLLDKGADVNTQDQRGRSPLILAAKRGNTEMVGLLLTKGADPTIKDANGQTAYLTARRRGSRQVAQMLSQFASSNELDNVNKKYVDPPKQDSTQARGSSKPSKSAIPRWIKAVLAVGVLIAFVGILAQAHWSSRERAREAQRREARLEAQRREEQAAREREERLMRQLPTCERLIDLFNTKAGPTSWSSIKALEESISIEESHACWRYGTVPGVKISVLCYACANTATGRLDFVEEVFADHRIIYIGYGCRCK